MSSASGNLANETSRFRFGTLRDPSNQIDLRYGVCYDGPGEPQRYVVIANGRTEWIEKYEYLIHDLGLPSDTAVLAWDHRGQGASGGARAWVDHYESFARDTGAIVSYVVGNKPYVVMAHSMGALICLYATLKGYLKPDALVLSSPLLGMPNAPVPTVLAKPVSKLLTLAALGTVSTGGGDFTAASFEKNNLTHHYDRYQKMLKTPYPVPAATFGWVSASFAATTFVFDPKNLAKLTVPTLVAGGTEEAVVDFKAFQKWVGVASQHAKAPVQLRLIPGARHELWSEIPDYYDQVLAAVRDWFKEFLR